MQLGDKKLIVQRASVGAKNANLVSASPRDVNTVLVTNSQAVTAKIKTFMKNALLITYMASFKLLIESEVHSFMLCFHADRCCRDARHAPGPRTAEDAELRPADG
uniref:Uncharacterized protein n=1 Tax=Sinocyclocheilus grahami TaxID=75366 RepID=A0A672KRP3_SINGR